MTSQRIPGKRTFITGAGAGIGRATALRFAQEGARVLVTDINAAAAESVAADARVYGGDAIAATVDVRNESQVAAAVARAVERWGGLDVVVANAAVELFNRDARVDELAADVWRETIDVNLTGTYLTCKYGVKALLASGGGSVIITASPTSLFGKAPGFDAYSASKAGVLGLVKVMAIDYAKLGVRVNAVVPGFTDTPMVRELMANDEWRKQLVSTIPLGRPGKPEEVASMMLFLASDDAGYATGGTFTVDGGMTAA